MREKNVECDSAFTQYFIHGWLSQGLWRRWESPSPCLCLPALIICFVLWGTTGKEAARGTQFKFHSLSVNSHFIFFPLALDIIWMSYAKLFSICYTYTCTHRGDNLHALLPDFTIIPHPPSLNSECAIRRGYAVTLPKSHLWDGRRHAVLCSCLGSRSKTSLLRQAGFLLKTHVLMRQGKSLIICVSLYNILLVTFVLL